MNIIYIIIIYLFVKIPVSMEQNNFYSFLNFPGLLKVTELMKNEKIREFFLTLKK